MASLKQRLWETARSTRHNLLHLKLFQVRFDGPDWHIDERNGTSLRFPFNPYLSFFEIEGYLRQGKWELCEGMTVIDAGAAVGEFALYASRKVGPSGKVLMLEPDPDNLRQAKELFDYNGGQPANLEIVPVALWKEKGSVSFASGLSSCSTVVDTAVSIPDTANIVDVPAESLASLAVKFKLDRVDFVKIDIEGSEVPVMENAEAFVKQFSPKFSIASYHPWENGLTRDVLEPIFKRLGYQCRSGFPKHLTTWAALTL